MVSYSSLYQLAVVVLISVFLVEKVTNHSCDNFGHDTVWLYLIVRAQLRG